MSEQKQLTKEDIEARYQVIKRSEIEIKDGEIITKSLQQLHRSSEYLISSGMLPKTFDTPQKASIGIMLCKELGLKPLIALRNVSIINGSPSIWGELPLAIARKSGQLKYIREYSIDKDYNEICLKNKNLHAEVFSAVCEIQREGYDKQEFYYTKFDADKNPNSSDPKNNAWKNHRSIMMMRRARSLALKCLFGDFISGLSIAEYDYDLMPSDDRKTYETTATRVTQNSKTKAVEERLLCDDKDLPPSLPSEETRTGETGEDNQIN